MNNSMSTPPCPNCGKSEILCHAEQWCGDGTCCRSCENHAAPPADVRPQPSPIAH